jgi:hypothetical protein
MPTLVSVEPLANYRLKLAYDDGASGHVDLSQFAGRGVFGAWRDVAFFNQVRIGELGELSWGNEIELCPDALYIKLTEKSVEEIFPALRADSHA